MKSINNYEIYEVKYPGWSPNSLDFINECISTDPSQRLGAKNGAKELKNHPWLKDIDWKILKECRYQSPLLQKL